MKTARDFIDKVVSVSGTSGKPYLIRFDHGKEIPSRDFLLAQLQGWKAPSNLPAANGRGGNANHVHRTEELMGELGNKEYNETNRTHRRHGGAAACTYPAGE